MAQFFLLRFHHILKESFLLKSPDDTNRSDSLHEEKLDNHSADLGSGCSDNTTINIEFHDFVNETNCREWVYEKGGCLFKRY